MERYAELKLLLKTWEAEFLRENQRKPSKGDMERAPEDVQGFYREFRTLKETRGSTAGAEPAKEERRGSTAGAEPEKEEPVKEDGDSWGSHLNRGNVPPKLTPAERRSLNASAQYYGEKLKANMAAASKKDRPLSLKKPLTPRTPLQSEKTSLPTLASPRTPLQSEKTSLPSLATPHTPLQSEKPTFPSQATPTSPVALFPDETLDPENIAPPPLRFGVRSLTPASHNSSGRRLQQLQSQVGRRLSSLDHDWLERCQLTKGSPGQREAKTAEEAWPEMGRLSAPVDKDPPSFQRPSSVEKEAGKKVAQESVSDTPLGGSNERKALLVSHPPLGGSKEKEEVQEDRLASDSPLGGSKEQNKTRKDPERLAENPRKSLKESALGDEVEPSRELGGHPGRGDNMAATPEKKGKGSRKKSQKKAESEPDAIEPSREGQQWEREDNMTTSPEQKGKGSRKKRQRAASPAQEAEPEQSQSPSSKRRRKAKTTPEKKPRRRGQKKAKLDDDEEEAPEEPKSDQLTENILGEVIEEEAAQRMTTYTKPGVSAPPRRNENFVRINLKKKSHVKSFVLNGNRLRKQMWKQKWQKKGEQFGGGGRPINRGGDVCFHCNQTGHWASQCPGKVIPVVKAPEPESEEEELVLPTLEDVARMTNTKMTTLDSVGGDPAEVVPVVVRASYESAPPPPAMKPLYEPDAAGNVPDAPPEVYKALAELGYSSFRPGQEEAVMRILSGLSTLVILSTGMGKSLCYQLPAYLYAQRSPCITLVVSPLVSLMDDQVSGLPANLKAVCVHSNMTKNQRDAAMEKVKQGKVHVLLLSPEALVGGGQSGSSCLPPADQLPPVAFACIDEVHCVSEWSHNFRPCYLRLCKVLRERLGVRCLLGLTATATLSTAQDVSRHLGVSEDVQPRLAAVPHNLHLSVSMDRDRDQALVTLLKGDRFGCLDSIIIYCTRREETQRLAALLRTCLQGVTVKKLPGAEESEDTPANRKKALAMKKIRRPLKWMADTYHAGLSAAERRRVQNNFMSGQLRIVVATVAFGMGLDKSDVRGIIHYNMPKNFESYVQEIGRAGRDGKGAQCHLFLDSESQDQDELRRHIYADSVDYITVKKLVQRVLPKCKCRDIHRKQEALRAACEVDDAEMMDFLDECVGGGQEETLEASPVVKEVVERVCHRHERVLPIEDTVQALDVREEGIETLLCYLELHPCHWLELLHPTLATCRVTCYNGPQQLRHLAHRCPPVAIALARERLSGIDHTHSSSVEFNVVDIADSMGWETLPVKRALRDLQWKQSASGGFRGTGRSGILVEFSKLSFHFRSYGDLTDGELEEVCDFLHRKVTSRESAALGQLRACYRVFHRVAYRSSEACAERVNLERSAQLKRLILEYFMGKNPLEEEDGDAAEEELSDAKVEDWRLQLCGDVRQFLSVHHEERFTGRAIARIFHGIGSPCYPAQVYGRDRRFWRKYLHLDFNKIMQICKEEIIRLK